MKNLEPEVVKIYDYTELKVNGQSLRSLLHIQACHRIGKEKKTTIVLCLLVRLLVFCYIYIFIGCKYFFPFYALELGLIYS